LWFGSRVYVYITALLSRLYSLGGGADHVIGFRSVVACIYRCALLLLTEALIYGRVPADFPHDLLRIRWSSTLETAAVEEGIPTVVEETFHLCAVLPG